MPACGCAPLALEECRQVAVLWVPAIGLGRPFGLTRGLLGMVLLLLGDALQQVDVP